jgi:hypothetical protein
MGGINILIPVYEHHQQSPLAYFTYNILKRITLGLVSDILRDQPFMDMKGRIIMRIFWSLVGVVLVFVGAVWILQGVNILPGSFMTGQIQWAVYGGIAFVVGLGLMLVSNRRKAATTKK